MSILDYGAVRVPFYGDINVGQHWVKQYHLFDAKP